jgi:ABC-type branched-subunit amino acid transport system permease subunit
VAALAAIALATVVGVLIGLPALRLRGQQLVVVTMAGAIAISTMLFDNHSLTGVTLGETATVPKAEIGPFDVSVRDLDTGLSDRWQFGVFAMLVLLLLSFAVARIRSGRTGRRFLAIRSNERAAASCGIDVARTKLLAFGLSSAIAGCAGVLMAIQQTSIEALQFDVFAAIVLLSLVTIGGIAALSGAYFGGLIAAGGIISYFMKVNIHGLERYIALIGAVTVMLQIVLAPSGIVVKNMHDFHKIKEHLAKRKGRAHGASGEGEPPTAPDGVPTPPAPEPAPTGA